MLITISSCGTKVNKPVADIIKETTSYTTKINNNNHLSKITTEGVLTDVSGFKDIGKYTLNTYFDKQNNQLYRVENRETTDKIRVENFYFKENALVLVSSQINKESAKKLYVHNDKVINESNMDADYQKTLLAKAHLFRKEFMKAP